MIVGIDLGTTNSLIAYHSAEGPRLIPNALGGVLTPSVIGVDRDSHWLVGQAARELQVTHPERCAAAFQAADGQRLDGDARRPADGRGGAVEPGAAVAQGRCRGPLRRGGRRGRHHRARLLQRNAAAGRRSRPAGWRASTCGGFSTNRPPAAIAYSVHESQEDRVILVYDLGGGTFDVSIVDRLDGVMEIRASAGGNLPWRRRFHLRPRRARAGGARRRLRTGGDGGAALGRPTAARM